MPQNWKYPVITRGQADAAQNNDTELWATIPELNGRYDISNRGRLRSWFAGRGLYRLLEPRIRKTSLAKDGYRFATLYYGSNNKMKGFRVSRLVLLAFRGQPPSPQHQASHLNGDKTNNSLSNLAWETPQENDARKEIHGTRFRGEMHVCAKLSEAHVREIRTRRTNGERVCLLAKEFNITPSQICSVVSGRTWASVK